MTHAKRWAWAVPAAALAAGALCFGRPGGAGLVPPDKGAAPKLSEGLEYVPADAVAFVTVRVADVGGLPPFKAFREKLEKDSPELLQEATQAAGVAPDEIDRVTLVTQSLKGPEFELALVHTPRPFDRRKVQAAVAPGAKEEKTKDGPLYADPGGGRAVLFLDYHTFAVGRAEAVRDFLARPTGKEDPLGPALALAAEKHAAAAGVNVEAFAGEAGAPPPGWAPYQPLLAAQWAALTVDAGEKYEASLRVSFAREDDAKAGEKALAALLELARGGLDQRIKQLSKDPDSAALADLLKQAAAGLKDAAVQRKGATLTASAAATPDAKTLERAAADAAVKVREAAARTRSANNLHQIALAMQNHHAAFGRMPAQAIDDKDGKPLLSWRVQILPYLEQDDLYKEFRLDEPWDSDHNKKLLEKMPPVYAFPGDDRALKAHETYYQAFAGPGAFFDGKTGLRLPNDFPDGTSNTIVCVEAAQSVPWTKPEDIPFDQGKLVPKVGGRRKDRFLAGMVDGSVLSFPLSIKEDDLRALVTRNGGEVIDLDKLTK
jgi:hypothetical protein